MKTSVKKAAKDKEAAIRRKYAVIAKSLSSKDALAKFMDQWAPRAGQAGLLRDHQAGRWAYSDDRQRRQPYFQHVVEHQPRRGGE